MSDNTGASLRGTASKDPTSNQRFWSGTVVEPESEEDPKEQARRLYEADPVKYTKTGKLRQTPEERRQAILRGWSTSARRKLSRTRKRMFKKRREASTGPGATQIAEVEPVAARPARRQDRMIGILIDQIREELHQQIRDGQELTPFHTNVLALTDYLRKNE